MLSQQITLVQDTLQAQATHAVNLALTARNWLIGYYIVNYEQHGADRAQYGAQLMSRLAKRINRRGLDARRLREFRLFYLAYPQLLSAVENYVLTNAEIGSRSDKAQIWRLPSAILQSTEIKEDVIWRMPSAKLEKWQTPPERLFRRLNYSNLLYLSSITDDLNYYRHEVMQPDDNPPIGLLLCTDYGETTVRYATEGLSQNLFVSKYRLQLPSEEEIRDYLMANIDRNEFNQQKHDNNE